MVKNFYFGKKNAEEIIFSIQYNFTERTYSKFLSKVVLLLAMQTWSFENIEKKEKKLFLSLLKFITSGNNYFFLNHEKY